VLWTLASLTSDPLPPALSFLWVVLFCSIFSALSCTQQATNIMLIPKKNRVEVYKYLFQEGVLYAKKDFNAPKHPEIDVPNLQVIKLMQSFKSKEYVKESFAWRHYYWSGFFPLFFDLLFQ
jgi:hypothetical protein